MIDANKIGQITEQQLKDSPLFLVDITISPANDIEVIIDSDRRVDIADCVRLSKAIEGELDREQEDFQLTVSSAGVGRPLKLLRQYRKLVGKQLEVILTDGRKFIGELLNVEDDSITLSYPAASSESASDKKKVKGLTTGKFGFSEIKKASEHIVFQ